MPTTHPKKTNPPSWGRREFVITLTRAMGTASLVMAPGIHLTPGVGQIKPTRTVGQVMGLILKEIPGAPFRETVDTLKSGTADQPVTGIVTASFATLAVIEKAAQLGANFIIAHEPTFYNHRDETDWLESDKIYQHKRDLLQKHRMAVWRFHD